MIVAISAGRRTSPEVRARLALDRDGIGQVLRAPRPGLGELIALSTCHRTELYAVGDGSGSDVVHAAVSLLRLEPSDHTELDVLRDSDAVRHLYRVASGLDSLVVGEPQILGQVRDALTLARDAGAAGPELSTITGRAIRLGREVRRTTPLGGVSSSVGGIAADHIADRLGGLEGRRGAVVGAGRAASDAARALQRLGATLMVVSRSLEPATTLARAVGAKARPLNAISHVLDDSAFAVVAVNGGTLIDTHALPARAGRAPLVLVDLSVPPSVTGARADVEVTTIDGLSAPHAPDAVVEAAGRMVEDAVEAWERWRRTRPAGRDVGRFRMHAQNVVRAELSREIARLDLTEDEQERVAALAMRIANKLLHGPSVALRDADDETRRRILRMFDLEP